MADLSNKRQSDKVKTPTGREDALAQGYYDAATGGPLSLMVERVIQTLRDPSITSEEFERAIGVVASYADDTRAMAQMRKDINEQEAVGRYNKGQINAAQFSKEVRDIRSQYESAMAEAARVEDTIDRNAGRSLPNVFGNAVSGIKSALGIPNYESFSPSTDNMIREMQMSAANSRQATPSERAKDYNRREQNYYKSNLPTPNIDQRSSGVFEISIPEYSSVNGLAPTEGPMHLADIRSVSGVPRSYNAEFNRDRQNFRSSPQTSENRKAVTPSEVLLGEAIGVHKAGPAATYQDMLAIASAMVNRAEKLGVPLDQLDKITSVKSEFNAYDKALPKGAIENLWMAEQALNDVVTNGPIHGATFYATPAAKGNLPTGLKEVTRSPGHVFFDDPQNRSIKTVDGFKNPVPFSLPSSGVPVPSRNPMKEEEEGSSTYSPQTPYNKSETLQQKNERLIDWSVNKMREAVQEKNLRNASMEMQQIPVVTNLSPSRTGANPLDPSFGISPMGIPFTVNTPPTGFSRQEVSPKGFVSTVRGSIEPNKVTTTPLSTSKSIDQRVDEAFRDSQNVRSAGSLTPNSLRESYFRGKEATAAPQVKEVARSIGTPPTTPSKSLTPAEFNRDRQLFGNEARVGLPIVTENLITRPSSAPLVEKSSIVEDADIRNMNTTAITSPVQKSVPVPMPSPSKVAGVPAKSSTPPTISSPVPGMTVADLAKQYGMYRPGTVEKVVKTVAPVVEEAIKQAVPSVKQQTAPKNNPVVIDLKGKPRVSVPTQAPRSVSPSKIDPTSVGLKDGVLVTATPSSGGYRGYDPQTGWSSYTNPNGVTTTFNDRGEPMGGPGNSGGNK